MTQLVLQEKQIRSFTHKIIRSMAQDSFTPDYIVGITRGGLVPATMISHYLDVPMHTLNVSLRDGQLGPESNLWMAEDAYGYINKEDRKDPDISSLRGFRKNILIVDDINDSGRTLNWIKDDWMSGCMPSDEKSWNDIWHYNVRFAVMVHNQPSEFKDPDYVGMEINKNETPCWVVFPWENWWEI